ncbi:hypothetical protein B0T16DRAFT_393056 [Cercophora newfieldiana]|uniref:Uncharacterized protein n=1 Tax=Cercophora newfieldiana TaxID=92897 RepID=A0AA40CIY7_9PEZI|nr:hypothetical protein B0T16DRAFT_393056 [Cercophora newfieldiana]
MIQPQTETDRHHPNLPGSYPTSYMTRSHAVDEAKSWNSFDTMEASLDTRQILLDNMRTLLDGMQTTLNIMQTILIAFQTILNSILTAVGATPALGPMRAALDAVQAVLNTSGQTSLNSLQTAINCLQTAINAMQTALNSAQTPSNATMDLESDTDTIMTPTSTASQRSTTPASSSYAQERRPLATHLKLNREQTASTPPKRNNWVLFHAVVLNCVISASLIIAFMCPGLVPVSTLTGSLFTGTQNAPTPAASRTFPQSNSQLSTNPVFLWNRTRVDIVFPEPDGKCKARFGLENALVAEIGAFSCMKCVCDEEEQRVIGGERRSPFFDHHPAEWIWGCGDMVCFGPTKTVRADEWVPAELLTPLGGGVEFYTVKSD